MDPVFSFQDIVLISIAGLIFLLFGLIFLYSVAEKERRAIWVSMLFACLIPACLIGISLLHLTILSWTFAGLISCTFILLTIPLKRNLIAEPDIPSLRYDERDVVFSRRKLKAGDGRYEEYYQRRPEKKSLDDHLRSFPKLLSPETPTYHPFYSKEGRIAFDEIDLIYDQVDGEVSPIKQNLDTHEITKVIRKNAKKLGAYHVANTPLKEYHIYSMKGRGENYGKVIEQKHTYAIVVTVEMDRDMNRTAPKAPTAYESAKRYLEVAKIAIHLADHIRKLGFSARAHIDANYEVLCSLLARDAGIAEIGRMGIGMSQDLGPRFRIAVVTTSLDLKTDPRTRNLSMLEFCKICRKCATNCPVGAIPKGNMQEINGVKKWQINQDVCFSYWCKMGTDCGKCMAVCPYSHPDNSLHRFVKRLIKRNLLFRRFALLMDDLFYGKYPAPYPVEKLNNSFS
ncbi:4Fe-4S dicluster domain-containing protein [Bacteroidota bacterium]